MTPSKTDALIVIDVQNDFLPGGALAVKDGDKIIAPIKELIGKFATVVVTQDFHPSFHVSFASAHDVPPFAPINLPLTEGGTRSQMMWPDHCVGGQIGAEIADDLGDILEEKTTILIRKGTDISVDSYSAFRENLNVRGERPSTGLGAMLKARGIERCFFVGLAFDFCVAWSAKDAVQEGLKAAIISMATRSVFPENDKETMFDLEANGVVVIPAL